MKSKGELTKERILAEATRLVNKKGFEATSINDLMTVTGLKKGCLYFHFSDKEELSFAVLKKAKDDFLAFLDNSLAGKTPSDRLEHFLKETLELNRNREFEGCLFGNTAVEMSGKNLRMSKFVDEVFAEWIERLSDVIRDAQDIGEIRKDLSAAVLARHVVMSIEGGIMLARLQKSEKPLRECITSLRTLLGMKR